LTALLSYSAPVGAQGRRAAVRRAPCDPRRPSHFLSTHAAGALGSSRKVERRPDRPIQCARDPSGGAVRSGGGAALQESQIVAFFATINNRLLISLATHASELQNSSVRSNAHPPVAELVRAWGSARCGPPKQLVSTGQRSAAEPVAADVSRRGLPSADWAGSSPSPGRPDRLLPGTPPHCRPDARSARARLRASAPSKPGRPVCDLL
jgi:hypothetical protein